MSITAHCTTHRHVAWTLGSLPAPDPATGRVAAGTCPGSPWSLHPEPPHAAYATPAVAEAATHTLSRTGRAWLVASP